MRRIAFLAVFAALAALGAWIAGEHLIARTTPVQLTATTYNRDEAYFYRFRAGFRVKETGEHIDFDYVVVCDNIRLTRWSDGTLTDISPFSPRLMVQATAGGQAVMVQTLKACSGLTSDNDDVPHDLLPIAVWFDSVDDLSIGIGYLSEDAYENPLAKLQFLGARVDRAARAEWEAWRQKAAADYVQRGALPGPWGRTSDSRFDLPPRGDNSRCNGYRRLKLPAGVRKNIRELWPSERPRFWIPKTDDTKTLDLLSFDPTDPSARGSQSWIRRFGTLGEREKGLPIRSGRQVGPAPHLPVSWPTEIYPVSVPPVVSAHPLTRVPPSPAVESYANKLEFREGALNGFAMCQNIKDAFGRTVVDADAQWSTKRYVLSVDDVVVREWRNDLDGLLRYNFIFERDEYVFTRFEAPLS
jgi:hypothetical protein